MSSQTQSTGSKEKLLQFLSDSFSFGCIKGFRYFETYMRGREELILRVYNDRRTPRERGNYTATGSITNRYHGKLFLSPQIQEIIAKNQLNSNPSDFASLPPASPCDRELENEKDKTAFLIAGYARYKCPYVWIRSNHEKMGITNPTEKDLPLRLATIVNWKHADIKIWDIVAELIGNALQPPPANPFAIDHAFFDSLSVEESLITAGSLLSFLWKIFQSNYPFKDLILKDIEMLAERHLNEFQDLLVFGTSGKREIANSLPPNNATAYPQPSW